MVKDSKPKKATKRAQEKNLGGRPRRDPNTLRTDRLVIRVHPDLMTWLGRLSAENGITRSMLVERTLVSFVNLSQPQPILDYMGRELKSEPPPQSRPLGTPESFRSIWQRAIGGDPAKPRRHPADYEPPSDDDH